jgi:hypothetical protein
MKTMGKESKISSDQGSGKRLSRFGIRLAVFVIHLSSTGFGLAAFGNGLSRVGLHLGVLVIHLAPSGIWLAVFGIG